MKRWATTTVFLFLAASASSQSGPGVLPFRDPRLPIPVRVDDLISRLTLEEKAGQLYAAAPAIPRLGIPAFTYSFQCMNGVKINEPATLFPVPIAMSATWDAALIQQVATAVSDEVRAFYNSGVRNGVVYRAPVIDMCMHPLWGRIQESWGEDPQLTTVMAGAYIRGMEGDDPKYLKLAATLKHFGPNNQEHGRESLDVALDERSMNEYWGAAFRNSVQKNNAQSIMAAYNSVNRTPVHINRLIVTDLFKKAWGLQGFAVEDSGGVGFLVTRYHISDDYAIAIGKAMNAGLDMGGKEYRDYLPEAVKRGLTTEAALDASLRRVLGVRFRLGTFDPPEDVSYSKIGRTVIGAPKHIELALQASRESIVLLKNANRFLPLDRTRFKSVAVIGPAANSITPGQNTALGMHLISPLQGIKDRVTAATEVLYAPGAEFIKQRSPDAEAKKDPARVKALIADAVAAAKRVQLVVLCVGTTDTMEYEWTDRSTMNLTADQEQLVKEVYAANPKTVLVLMNGGPLAVNWANRNMPAIVAAWWPGEQGGHAIADVVFGDYNPAGRLPYTVYHSADDVPPMTEYDVTKGFTYMYFNGTPLFPFGYGLSYTKFAYSSASVRSATVRAGESATVTVTLRNTGDRAGDEVAQLYARQEVAGIKTPRLKLCDFRRVHLAPGESATVSMQLPTEVLAYYDVPAHRFVTAPGKVEALVGSSSADLRPAGSLRIVQ